ncbi:MAG: hydrogenase maturation nickel metallochaperone HypA [Nitrospira sp.]|nr:hydrogenase maturation nickel metallochaperone HypA [Nitrospira sp.]
MHELHLMKHIVKVVETKLAETVDGKLSAVRLKVSARSHLLAHDHFALQTAFVLAARGTKAEGVTLDIIPVPGHAWCLSCNRETTVSGPDDVCTTCDASMIAQPTEPEVVIHELVVQE